MTPDDALEEARILVSGDDPVAAEAYLQQAMARFPQDAELTLLHGTLLMLTDPARAPLQIATAVGLDPTDPWIWVQGASLMLSLDETEAARSYLGHAFELRDGDESPLTPVLAQVGARLAAADGEDALAEEAFSALVETYPRDTQYLCSFARYLASRDRLTEARELLDQAADTCDDPDALQRCRDWLGD